MAPINDTIPETIRLGLISQVNGKYTVDETLIDSNETFLDLIENRLIRPNTPDQYGHAEFQMALAYLMTKNPTSPIDWAGPISNLISSDCPDETKLFELTNPARFQNFAYWARFLGFARLLRHGTATKVIPDPTAIVGRHLPTAITTARTTDIHTVLVELSKMIPELDYGTVREIVESKMISEREETLSATLTLAIARLAQSKLIATHDRPDAAGVLQLSPLSRPPGMATLSDLEVA